MFNVLDRCISFIDFCFKLTSAINKMNYSCKKFVTRHFGTYIEHSNFEEDDVDENNMSKLPADKKN